MFTSSPRETLAAIADLPLSGTVRILNLCGDQERAISVFGLRRALPEQVRLLAGPGSAASICPQSDVYQAIQLATRHPVTLLTAPGMLRLPVDRHLPAPHTLAEAQAAGGDVRSVSAPVEAVLLAREQPTREMVYFVAGFETLLAPLAGMILDGLPDNLSVLVCGRRVDPLLEHLLLSGEAGFEALLLPGNRCAVTGTRQWERISGDFHVPAAVAGYTGSNILNALHQLLRQHCAGDARVDNCYRALVRPDGNAMARDQLDRVFELADGGWRGVGGVPGSAFRLRHAYEVLDADHRYPDHRHEIGSRSSEMPNGCDCAAVLLGNKDPHDCRQFRVGCGVTSPYGPCMASDDGTCSLRSADQYA